MKGKNFFILSGCLLALGCSQNKQNTTTENETPKIKNKNNPNVVIIFADDLGYGDLGCFGAKDIKTPNLDKIAKQGIKFTECYSASPISSPSRAALLTGRMPQRMGINGVFFPESFTGMPTKEVTTADMLKKAGYATGIVGKWHLGHHKKYLPLQRGFDEYYGIPYSNDMKSVVYMNGNEVDSFDINQTYTTKTYTDKAVDFISRHKDENFFLYLAHSMPHVPIYASPRFQGTSERGLYGDVIQEIDWSVGEIVKKLEEYGIAENTLIIFSSDNGPWLCMDEHGGSAGELREGKQYTFEGGVRVPTVAMWPKEIKAGTVYNDMITLMDWFPTICSYLNLEMPKDRVYDGKNIMPVLTGTGKREQQKHLYFLNEDLRCYRKGNWKVKKAFDGHPGAWWKQKVDAHPDLLFNLKEDPGERNNLAEKMPDKLKEMFDEMENEYKKMGNLPPSLVIKTSADNAHYKYLKEKYGTLENRWKK